MLKILLNTVDISEAMENYLIDEYPVTLQSTDEIVVGYYKPINALYVEMKDINTTPSKMSVYYYNGTSYTTIPKLRDNTKGFFRSGFILWDRNLTNEASSTVMGESLYWYKIKLDSDSSLMSIKGINLVFSDDNDLKEEYPSIMDMLPDGEPSFIGFHVASRKDILSYFKSQGKLITGQVSVGANNNVKAPKLVDQFDLLNIEEVRDASKFLTLAKILYWISDAVDDKWHQKAKYFEQKFGDKINMASLSLDSNDNGKADQSEIAQVQFIRIERQ